MKFCAQKKLKDQNRLKSDYLVGYYNRCLQLKFAIEGVKTLESLLIKISQQKIKC